MANDAAKCASGETREQACADYCNLYYRACYGFQDPSLQDVYTYSGELNCTDVCNDSIWPIGDITEKGSVLCRCYHAYRALTEGKTPHCYHSAEVPSMEGGCAL